MTGHMLRNTIERALVLLDSGRACEAREVLNRARTGLDREEREAQEAARLRLGVARGRPAGERVTPYLYTTWPPYGS